MEQRRYKAINFDLYTHELKKLYPGTNYRHAYYDIRFFFLKNNFIHRQGSGYVSTTKLTVNNSTFPPVKQVELLENPSK